MKLRWTRQYELWTVEKVPRKVAWIIHSQEIWVYRLAHPAMRVGASGRLANAKLAAEAAVREAGLV